MILFFHIYMNVNKLRLKQYNTGEVDVTLRFHQFLTGGSSHFTSLRGAE